MVSKASLFLIHNTDVIIQNASLLGMCAINMGLHRVGTGLPEGKNDWGATNVIILEVENMGGGYFGLYVLT